MGVYPFMLGGCTKDFEPIYETLKSKGLKEPYDWTTYPSYFTPKAQELEKLAREAEQAGDKDKASEYYIRSSTVYRFARFPAVRSPAQKEAWEKSKETVKKGLKLKAEVNGYPPVHEVLVPHKHALEHEGKEIPIFYQLPTGASKSAPVPCMVIITGLDGFRTELCVWAEGWRRNNVAVVILEIPGTGDSPADAKDPKSPDRMFTSLFEWVEQQDGLDKTKICAQGFSTGGFYAIRLAHTHPDKLAGSICFGGGCHHSFDREWLDNVNHLEYPFECVPDFPIPHSRSCLTPNLA
jgi:Esterase FrsA-like